MRDFCETRLGGAVLSVTLLVILCLSDTVASPLAAQEKGAPATPQEILPPVAKVVPKRLEAHGHVRIDNYYWLSERENPEVTAYLEAENAYTEAVMARTRPLQETLFEEIKGRFKESDLSVPWREGDYFYYYRWEEEKEYPIYARKRGSLGADEEILLDVNKIAEGHAYTRVRFPAISDDQNIMAFAVDTVGRHFSTIRFKDLDAGQFLDDVIDSVTANLAWANDNRTLFYAKQTRPPVEPRPYQSTVTCSAPIPARMNWFTKKATAVVLSGRGTVT